MNNLAPIALFVYARPSHTLRTLEALSRNEFAADSVLFVYADGAKEDATEQQIQNIQEVRRIVKSRNWCREVHLIEREKNFGLSKNLSEGITGTVKQYGKIIVLEDDILTSPYFLRYCNEALTIYEDAENVYSVNAFQFQSLQDDFDVFLSPLATSSWGWATWAKRWAAFDGTVSEKDIIQNNDFWRSRFNFAGYNYAKMLDNSKSWAIRWYYSVFVRNGLGVFPTVSLTQNFGFDGSGENCGNSGRENFLSDRYKPLSRQYDTINLQLVADMHAVLKAQFPEKNQPVEQGSLKKLLRSVLRR
jgi:hypothetical protein